MSEFVEKGVVKHLSDSVEFDFDEFEIVELENREEFKLLMQCEGGGCGGGTPPKPLFALKC